MKRLVGIAALSLIWCATGAGDPVEVTTSSVTLDARIMTLTRSADEQTLETWTSSSVVTAQDRKIDTITPLGTVVIIR